MIAFSRLPRLFPTLAALWLQVTVLVFVYLQTKRGVSTPVTDWMHRALRLLSE